MNVSRSWFVMLRQICFDQNKLIIMHKVSIHEEMFRTANPRGLEIVIHFLLTKLDPVKSREKFKPCWPIQNKNEERQFRKLCVDWLNDLGDISSSLVFNSTRKPSVILLNPLGDKVYVFLFYFTSYVIMNLLQACSNKYKHYSAVLPQAGNESKYALIPNGAMRTSKALTIENLRHFLFCIAHHRCSITIWSETIQSYCEEIYHLRKMNKEFQHRISDLLNVSKNSTSCDTQFLTDNLLSEQMIHLCNTLDLYTSHFATLDEYLLFGNQRTILDGRTIYIEVSDPILTSYEKLYRKGKIAALYSERNYVCLCAYIHVGRLSLVMVFDISDLIKTHAFFYKWHSLLQFINNENLIHFLTMLNSQMEIANPEQEDTKHYNSTIKSLQLEIMKWTGSGLSHLFVPLNLTEITNQMFSQIFTVANAPSTFFPVIRSIDRVAQIDDTLPLDSFQLTNSVINESVTSSEPLISHFSLKSTFSEYTSTVQQDSPYVVNECFKLPTEHVSKRIHKSEQQILEELTDRISHVILSTDSPLFEDHFSSDPLESLNEYYAFHARDDLNRTPNPLISMTATDNAIWMENISNFEETQSQSVQGSPSSKLKFLSPLKDDDY